MRTLLIVLEVIIAVGVVVGFSRGWFGLSSGSDEGKTNITLTVDEDKIDADKDKVADKVRDLGDNTADEIEATTGKAKD